MRLRLGLMTGFAAGYVLGAKAGQERYEQIRRQFNELMGTEQAQQLQSQMREVASRASEVIEEKASTATAKVSEMVGSGVGGGSSSSSSSGGSSSTGSTSGSTGAAGTEPGIVLPDI